MTKYALFWGCDDGSASGVIPYLFTDRDAVLIELLREHYLLDGSKAIEAVPLRELGRVFDGELPDELCKVAQEERKRQQEV